MKNLKAVLPCLLVAGLFLIGVEKAEAACEPGPGQVAFYEHPNYTGPCVVLDVGRYENPAAIGIRNDSISSAKLGSGAWAISYQNFGFKGLTYRHETSQESFPAKQAPNYPFQFYNHDDKISSLEVMSINPNSAGPTPVATYLGQHPTDRDNGWSEGLQGVGHDQNNWFFTQQTRLWKFPLGFDLNRKISGALPTGVKMVSVPAELKAKGYNHFGDLVHYKGFLYIPLEAKEGGNSSRPLLVVYRASNLVFVGSTPLNKQTRAGWLAINPKDGILYTSGNHMNNMSKLISYRIEFAELGRNNVVLKSSNTKTLYDENGRDITLKKYMQGGDFSDDGKYLFLVNGTASKSTPARDGGIWVFDFKTGKKVLKSAGSGAFRFEYRPGAPNAEEPEGITYWNFTEGRAPKIKGNLHAILLNNDALSSDNFWFKHYSIDYTKAGRDCEASNERLCSDNGATCGVVGKIDGSAAEVCRWTNVNSVSACNKTSGIWTTPNSKYAKNHPDAVVAGSNGACLTEVANIRSKLIEELNEQGGMVIMRPFPASSTADKAGANNAPPPDDKKSALAAPSDLQVSDITNTTLTLSWTDNSDREFGVELYRMDPVAARRERKAGWEFIGLFEERVGSNVKGTGRRTDQDYELEPDTNYCYRLRAYSGFDRTEVSGFSKTICTKTNR
jgi:hypothetical protein